MFPIVRRLGMFVVGFAVGTYFGYLAFVAQDDAWYRFDWRKFILPPAFLVGSMCALLGDKPIHGTWSSIVLGIFVGGVSGTIGGILVGGLVEYLADLDREMRSTIGFCTVLAGLPLGMFIGGIVVGRLGKKQREKQRPDRRGFIKP